MNGISTHAKNSSTATRDTGSTAHTLLSLFKAKLNNGAYEGRWLTLTYWCAQRLWLKYRESEWAVGSAFVTESNMLRPAYWNVSCSHPSRPPAGQRSFVERPTLALIIILQVHVTQSHFIMLQSLQSPTKKGISLWRKEVSSQVSGNSQCVCHGRRSAQRCMFMEVYFFITLALYQTLLFVLKSHHGCLCWLIYLVPACETGRGPAVFLASLFNAGTFPLVLRVFCSCSVVLWLELKWRINRCWKNAETENTGPKDWDWNCCISLKNKEWESLVLLLRIHTVFLGEKQPSLPWSYDIQNQDKPSTGILSAVFSVHTLQVFVATLKPKHCHKHHPHHSLPA